MKTSVRERINKRFGSRRVFIVFSICFWLTVATMLLSVIFYFAFSRHTVEKLAEHIALCVLAIILLFIPVFMRTRLKFQAPAFLQIIVTVFIIAHCVLGEIYRWYDYIPLYDKILHITAGAVIAILGFSIVYGFSKDEAGRMKLSPFFIALFSFCFALALLAIWEIFEYSMDSIFGWNMQRYMNEFTETEIDGVIYWITSNPQGGLVDTMEDIIVGVIGAAVFSVIGGLWVKKHPDDTSFYVTKIPQATGAAEAAKDKREF